MPATRAALSPFDLSYLFLRFLPLPFATGFLGRASPRPTQNGRASVAGAPATRSDHLVWPFPLWYSRCCPGACAGIGGSRRRVAAPSRSRSVSAIFSLASSACWPSTDPRTFLLPGPFWPLSPPGRTEQGRSLGLLPLPRSFSHTSHPTWPQSRGKNRPRSETGSIEGVYSFSLLPPGYLTFRRGGPAKVIRGCSNSTEVFNSHPRLSRLVCGTVSAL